ncbi:MAG TPA: hypothetical protein VKZ45_03980 [Vicingaceae bacterium]|nr:hypothetical protein [Vicingaceae bacterium]
MSKLKYFVFFILSLTASCNKTENKPENDYKVIETDYFIIKSKYDFGKSQFLIENELPEKIISKDSLKHIIYSTSINFNENVALSIMILDEKFIHFEEDFRSFNKEFIEKYGVEPYIHYDTVINSNKMELTKLRLEPAAYTTYLNVNILKEENCYLITLIYEGDNYEDANSTFFEILEGTTIKE